MNRRSIALFLLLLCAAWRLTAAGPSDEVRALLEQKKYAIVLEKCLAALNDPKKKPSPEEAAYLLYAAGRANQGLNNPTQAANFFKRVEETFPLSSWLLPALNELAEIQRSTPLPRYATLLKIVDKFPASAEARRAAVEIGRFEVQNRGYQRALLVLERMLLQKAFVEEQPEALLLAAVCYDEMRNNVKAAEYLRLGETRAPQLIQANPFYLHYAGKIAFDNVNFARAAVYLERLLNTFPRYERAWEAALQLAQALEKTNKPFLATVKLAQELDKKPAESIRVTLMLNLARILQKLTEEDQRRFASTHPRYADVERILENVQASTSNYEEKREAAILRGTRLSRENKSEEALRNYYEFVRRRRDPLVEEFFRQSVDDFVNRSYAKNEYEPIFRFWLEIRDTKSLLSGNTLLKIARVMTAMNLSRNAAEILDHLLKYQMYKEVWAGARQEYIRVKFQLRLYADCLRLIDDSAGQEPPDGEFLYYKLTCLERLGRTAELRRLLGALAVEKVGNNYQAGILLLQARFLKNERKTAEAEGVLLRLAPYNGLTPAERAYVWTSLGDCRFLQNDPETALKYYTMAEPLGRNVDWLLYQKVRLLRQLKRDAEAGREFDRLAKLHPDSFWLRQLRRDVR